MRSKLAALAFCLVGAVGFAAPALAFDPTGLWTPSNEESRYEIDYCPDNPQTLCARLVWIREDVQNERNTRYLNQYMLQNARQTATDVWQGTVRYEGLSVGGTLTQTSENRMQIEACALFVLCETINLRRVSE